ncbi:MAG: hypothetical protein K2X62_00860 [Beijerinckiaceae bacterium]|nr:hypothetical protein [Beijerinckiaceae bacterium]
MTWVRISFMAVLVGALTGVETKAQVAPNLLQKKPQQDAAPTVGPRYDMIGLKLGMDLADADRIIRSHMQVGHAFEVDTKSPTIGLYTTGSIYISDTGRDIISVAHVAEGNRRRVVALGRGLIMPRGSFVPQKVMEDLRAKYGPEKMLGASASNVFSAHWLNERLSRAQYEAKHYVCFGMPVSQSFHEFRLPPESEKIFRRGPSGAYLNDAEKLPFQRYMFLPWPNFQAQAQADAQKPGMNCPEAVHVDYSGAYTDMETLYVTITDHAAMLRMAAAGRRDTPSKVPAIKF